MSAHAGQLRTHIPCTSLLYLSLSLSIYIYIYICTLNPNSSTRASTCTASTKSHSHFDVTSFLSQRFARFPGPAQGHAVVGAQNVLGHLSTSACARRAIAGTTQAQTRYTRGRFMPHVHTYIKINTHMHRQSPDKLSGMHSNLQTDKQQINFILLADIMLPIRPRYVFAFG